MVNSRAGGYLGVDAKGALAVAKLSALQKILEPVQGLGAHVSHRLVLAAHTWLQPAWGRRRPAVATCVIMALATPFYRSCV